MVGYQQHDGKLSAAQLRYLEQEATPMEWSPEQGASRRAKGRGRLAVEQQIALVEKAFLAAAVQPLRGILDAFAGASFCSLFDAIGRMPNGKAERQYRNLVSQVPSPGLPDPEEDESMESWTDSERRGKQVCMYVLLGEAADGRLELLGCMTMDHSTLGSVKLWDIAADAQSHGLGIGDALLTAAKGAAAQAGCGLSLEAVRQAHSFYAKHDFGASREEVGLVAPLPCERPPPAELRHRLEASFATAAPAGSRDKLAAWTARALDEMHRQINSFNAVLPRDSSDRISGRQRLSWTAWVLALAAPRSQADEELRLDEVRGTLLKVFVYFTTNRKVFTLFTALVLPYGFIDATRYLTRTRIACRRLHRLAARRRVGTRRRAATW